MTKKNCSVSPIKLIHLKAVFNSIKPLLMCLILKKYLLFLLTVILWEEKTLKEEMREMQNFCLLALLSLGPLCGLSHLPLLHRPPALPQFPLKCQMQQLSASERGAPWWERAALLTWRPRLFSAPLFGVSHPTFSADVVWGSTGCKGMSFFSPGHVNGLAQKRWLILSESGSSVHRKRLFRRAVFFFFLFFFLEEDGGKKAETCWLYFKLPPWVPKKSVQFCCCYFCFFYSFNSSLRLSAPFCLSPAFPKQLTWESFQQGGGGSSRSIALV